MNIDDVVRTHWSPIFYFVLGWVHDREVAADLTQDCFWKACKGWEQFRGESTVYTWLRHIALNTIHTFAPKPANSVLVPRSSSRSVYHRGPAAAPASLCRKHSDLVRTSSKGLARGRVITLQAATGLCSALRRGNGSERNRSRNEHQRNGGEGPFVPSRSIFTEEGK